MATKPFYFLLLHLFIQYFSLAGEVSVTSKLPVVHDQIEDFASRTMILEAFTV